MSEVCKENSTAKSRISAFEKTIKESKPVDEQKQRQRARFEAKLSKFENTSSSNLPDIKSNNNNNSHAERTRRMFDPSRPSIEDEEKANAEKRANFARKLSNFDAGLDPSTVDDSLEEQRKRAEEEAARLEEQQRKESFKAKAMMFQS